LLGKENLVKKSILLAILFSLLVAGNGFAANQGWSIGAEFSLNWTPSTYPVGAALCLKFPGLPIMFGISARFEHALAIGVTADWWLFQTAIVGPLYLYIGPGLFFSIDTGPGTPVDFGIRVPFGFQIFIVPAFEIFLEPALAIHIYPVLPTFGIQAAIGLRFWF
jgi:hypothetical protein